MTEARVSQQLVEAVAQDTTPGARVSQMLIEAVARDTTPGARVSQMLIEAVAERDYAQWDMMIEGDLD